MATNSQIVTRLADGSYRGVYCHFDGHPGGVGTVLQQHYNSQEQAERATSLGALSELGASMECPVGHSYSKPVKGYTVAFHRDRGEELLFAEAETLQGCLDAQPFGGAEYFYVWQGAWRTMSESDLTTLGMESAMGEGVGLDDVISWPCGTWCYRADLPDYSHKSDDYQVLKTDSREWQVFLELVGEP